MPTLISCPECGARIRAEELVLPGGGRCPACQAPVSVKLHGGGGPVQEFARGLMAKEHQARSNARKPLHISVRETPGGGRIVIRAGVLRLLLLFGLIGAICYQVSKERREGRDSLVWLFGTTGAAVVLYTMAQIVNRTTFDVSPAGLKVTRGPVAWLHRDKSFALEEIFNIHVEDRIDPFGVNDTQRRFHHLMLMTTSGESIHLLGGQSRNSTHYLEKALGELLTRPGPRRTAS